ncbi:MAG: hypothetical protein U0Z53_06725 [Blastocatellia bacterium]
MSLHQNRNVHQWSLLAFGLLLCLAGSSQAQTLRERKAQPKPEKKAQPEKNWNLEITDGQPVMISLRAERAAVAEMAAELGRRLGVTITVSSALREHPVTSEFIGLPLEQALRLLAPQAVIDYSVGGGAEAQRKYLAIHLQGFNETPPEPTLQPNASAASAEGGFDDESDAANEKEENADAPLRVTYKSERLSVRARKQSLQSVLSELATKTRVICELRGSADEEVDLNFNDYTLEDAARALSPGVKFYLRTNLQTMETRLWRIVLMAAPEKPR